MNRECPITRKNRFKNGVLAALEICDGRRAEESGLDAAPNGSTGGKRRVTERTAAIVDAAAARLEAGDLTALQSVCASQVLALDVIFNQCARESVKQTWLSRPSMAMALKAQSQCRATLKALVSLERGLAGKKSRNFDEQTIGNGMSPAGSDAWRGPKTGAEKTRNFDEQTIANGIPPA